MRESVSCPWRYSLCPCERRPLPPTHQRNQHCRAADTVHAIVPDDCQAACPLPPACGVLGGHGLELHLQGYTCARAPIRLARGCCCCCCLLSQSSNTACARVYCVGNVKLVRRSANACKRARVRGWLPPMKLPHVGQAGRQARGHACAWPAQTPARAVCSAPGGCRVAATHPVPPVSVPP